MFAAIAEHCKNLTVLDISNCVDPNVLGEDAIIAVAKHRSTSLLALNLSWIPEVSDAAICAIAERCTNIQVLDLFLSFGYSEMSLAQIVAKCVHLKQIIFEGDEKETVINKFRALVWKMLRPEIEILAQSADTHITCHTVFLVDNTI